MKSVVSVEPIGCRLTCFSSSEHLSQVYSGFGLLARKGLIRLKPHKARSYHPGIDGVAVTRADIANGPTLVYDLSDSDVIDQSLLEGCDFYFKRSFCENTLGPAPISHKIRPLGFNYPICSHGDFGWLRCLWSWTSDSPWSYYRNSVLLTVWQSSLLSRLVLGSRGKHGSRLHQLEGLPISSPRPGILFVTRLWDPKRAKSPALREAREQMNEMRLTCIRRLRQEFGPDFYGGVQPTPYAAEHFKDFAIDSRFSNKRKYLSMAKQASICISTRGLQESNPWKLGEYVALSKAIVSEPLVHAVPGEFKRGENYAEFNTPDECVEHTASLFTDADKRYEMMLHNHTYYHSYLRPDMLVWNTLQTALAAMNRGGDRSSLALAKSTVPAA